MQGGVTIRLGHARNVTVYRTAMFYDLTNSEGHPHAASAALGQYRTFDVVIEQCYFEGFMMKTTDYTDTTRTILSRTTAKRKNIAPPDSESKYRDYPTTGVTYPMDHAHYWHGFYDILIQYNFMTGWSHSSYGGLKVRNGSKGLIYRNIVYNIAGIITYNYNNGESPPPIGDKQPRGSKFSEITVQENLVVNENFGSYSGYF